MVATLNDLAGVSNVTWAMIAVDELTYNALSGVPTNYTLVISGPNAGGKSVAMKSGVPVRLLWALRCSSSVRRRVSSSE